MKHWRAEQCLLGFLVSTTGIDNARINVCVVLKHVFKNLLRKQNKLHSSLFNIIIKQLLKNYNLILQQTDIHRQTSHWTAYRWDLRSKMCIKIKYIFFFSFPPFICCGFLLLFPFRKLKVGDYYLIIHF